MVALFLIVSTTTSFAQSTTTVNTTTDSKSDVKTEGKTIVISPPPSAISPSVGSSSSDLCTTGVSEQFKHKSLVYPLVRWFVMKTVKDLKFQKHYTIWG